MCNIDLYFSPIGANGKYRVSGFLTDLLSLMPLNTQSSTTLEGVEEKDYKRFYGQNGNSVP